MSQQRVSITVRGGRVLRGASRLFRSYAAALAQSRRVTTNPGVIVYDYGDDTLYAARGDHWISSDGERGVYEYGRGGIFLDVRGLEEEEES